MTNKYISEIVDNLSRHYSLAKTYPEAQGSFLELMRWGYGITMHNPEAYRNGKITLSSMAIGDFDIYMELKHNTFTPNTVALQVKKYDDSKLIHLEGIASKNVVRLDTYKIMDLDKDKHTPVFVQNLKREKADVIKPTDYEGFAL